MIIVGISPAPSTSPARAVTQPCVFENPYSFQNSPACASFTTVGTHILSIIPSSGFGKGLEPENIAALDDGSLMVQTNRSGLFRVVNRRIVQVWRPNPRCGPRAHFAFSLAGSIDDQAILQIPSYQFVPTQLSAAASKGYPPGFPPPTPPPLHVPPNQIAGVRTNGSLLFKWPSEFREAAQSADGVIWFLEEDSSNATLYAYFPRTHSRVALAPLAATFSIFRSPNGKVYAGTFKGLFELDAGPKVHARLVPVRTRELGDSPVQAVGRDGSLWASTITDILHIHPDGSIHVMRLIQPPSVMTHPWPLLHLKMAPDGSVWISGRKLVRISQDDHIDVLTVPRDSDWSGAFAFGPDSSIWTIVHDSQTNLTLGIVNFVPDAANRGGAIASPFGRTATAQPTDDYSPCPQPTQRPTPSPPLPPRTGTVYFVYAANGEPSSVAAYWASGDGKLVPVRGAPFLTEGLLESVTIDPSGRFLYASGEDGGIAVYRIDTQTGSLRPIAGSPFGNLRGPAWVAIDHSGRYAYANDVNLNNVTVYSIDANSGALKPVVGSPFAMGDVPFRLALNPTRPLAYVVFNTPIKAFETVGGAFKMVDEASLLKPPAHGHDILIDPHGKRAYITNEETSTVSTYAIDRRTGLLIPAHGPSVKAGVEPRDIRMGPSGRFVYVANISMNSSISVYRVNDVSGELTPIPGSPFRGSDGPQAMTITPDGAFLYATNFESKSIAGFEVDQRLGSLKPLIGSPFKAGDHPSGITSCRRIGNRCKP